MKYDGSSIGGGLHLSRDLVRASATFRHQLAERAQQRLAEDSPDRADLSVLLRTYLNEVPVALELLEATLSGADLRILEVGSGIGAVALCLAELGYDITGIEPGGPGFEDLIVLQGVVSAAASDLREDTTSQSGITILQFGVDDLDPAVHGRFDVVFSANVLEHVPDPVSALKRMQSVVAEGGYSGTSARTTRSPTNRTSSSRSSRSPRPSRRRSCHVESPRPGCGNR